jgi:RNA polymerase sigma-70 factor (ECF subfamily)
MSSRGDPRDFERFYNDHAGRVYAYCLRRTSRDLAEDALAETFAIAWRRRATVPPEPMPWLYEVARRVLANQARAARRQTAIAARLAREAPPLAPDSVSSRAEIDRVLAALAELRSDDRELLMLVAWEQLTPAQASVVIGTTAAVCRLRLLRARRRLSRLMSQAAQRPDQSIRPMKEAQP